MMITMMVILIVMMRMGMLAMIVVVRRPSVLPTPSRMILMIDDKSMIRSFVREDVRTVVYSAILYAESSV